MSRRSVVAWIDDGLMAHLNRQLGAAADLNGLFDRALVPSGPQAAVRGVEAACFRHGLADRDQLAGFGERAGRQGQSRAEAEGALLNRAGRQITHALQLIRRWGAIVEAHGGDS